MSDAEHIDLLVGMTGRTAAECAAMLQAAGGDIEGAANLLLEADPHPPSRATTVRPRHQRVSSDDGEDVDDIGWVTPQTVSTLSDSGGGGRGYYAAPRGLGGTGVEAMFPPELLQSALHSMGLASPTLSHAGYSAQQRWHVPRSSADAPSRDPYGAPPPRRGVTESVGEFRPPPWINSHRETTLKDLCALALQQSKWILLTVVPAREKFISACINRDFWRQETVAALVTTSFLTYQISLTDEEDTAVCASYGLLGTERPALWVLHPATRAVKHRFRDSLFKLSESGSLDSERLVDQLIAFVDESGVPAVTGTIGAGVTLNERGRDSTAHLVRAASDDHAVAVEEEASGGDGEAPSSRYAPEPAPPTASNTRTEDPQAVAETAPPRDESPTDLPTLDMVASADASSGILVRVRDPSGADRDLRIASNALLSDVAWALQHLVDPQRTRPIAVLCGFPPRKVISLKDLDPIAASMCFADVARERDRVVVQFE